MATDGLVAQLREIASDLTVIEINTIEASGMTGRKMPVWPHALIDIAQKYADFLSGPSVGLDLDAFREDFEAAMDAHTAYSGDDGESQDEDDAPEIEDEDERDVEARPAQSLRDIAPRFKRDRSFYSFQLGNGAGTFDLLRWAASSVLDAAEGREPAAAGASPASGGVDPRPEIGQATRTILIRIKRHCDQLKPTVQRLHEAWPEFVDKTRAELQAFQEHGRQIPRLHADTQTRIRKIWDIGTDRIVLQTLVQLDGDVIFRARRDALTSANQVFAKAHERATDTALGHWQGLFDLVVSLLTGRGAEALGRTDDTGR